jgi:hypothetical protein
VYPFEQHEVSDNDHQRESADVEDDISRANCATG